ncbi:Mov34/MPN/PAD-1 family protein [Coniochaeta sp. 2T2.1]|nr:Mov34/MPN/PAD-1 family protein [Coniochaeta sp. 2T2.1]
MPDDVRPSRPLSVRELDEEARNFKWNPNIPFKYWVRTADTLFLEARSYLGDGNYAKAYLLFLRHSALVFDHLAKHPKAKEPENKTALRPLLKRMPAVFKLMEEAKPHVDRAYEEWIKISAAQRDTREPKKPTSAYQRYAATDPALSWSASSRARLLDAGKHQELAVDLARKEIWRRDAARRATRQAGISDEEEQVRRSAGLWDNWDDRSSVAGPEITRYSEDKLRQDMEAARRLAAPGFGFDTTPEPDRNRHRPRPDSHSQTYHYPSISKPNTFDYDPEVYNRFREPSAPPPPRPSKESIHEPQPRPVGYPPPLIPRKELAQPPPYSTSLHELHTEPIPEPPPKIVESDKPSAEKERTTFKPSAYLENGKPLRTVFLPDRLRRSFLDIAADNTRKNLEMCGILCGTLVNNALFISHLLIPEQKCTSDTCETEDETAMLEFCIDRDLLMLGWIHTHPTQTCFMSSRDLHTQAGYQVMMPESIAIVCAPRHTPSWGIFRLTDPPGLPHVLHCNHTDTFHQHSIDNIYTDAGNPPGHVYETSKLEFSVHDLRFGATAKQQR